MVFFFNTSKCFFKEHKHLARISALHNINNPKKIPLITKGIFSVAGGE